MHQRPGLAAVGVRPTSTVVSPWLTFASVIASPAVLFWHFFSVAFYSIWVMFTHPYTIMGADGKPTQVVPSVDSYPYLFLKSIQVVRSSFFAG